MKKFFKISGIVAGAFLIIGVILTTVSCVLGADSEFKLFNTVNFSTGFGKDDSVKKEYTPIETFDSVDVNMKYGEVCIQEGKEFAIEYVAGKSSECFVKDSCLHFTDENEKGAKISFPFGNWGKNYYVKIYVPKDKKVDLEVEAAMGKISISGISGKILNVEADMGDVKIDKVSFESAVLNADMGNVTFDGMLNKSADITLSMGNCEVSGDLNCDISIEADMGNVEITTCYTSDSYIIDADCDMGSVNYNDKGGKKLSERKNIVIDNDMGNIDLNFVD